MIIKDKEFKDYTYIMAIANLSQDSFYNGSTVDEYTILKQVEKFIREGASIIDIGCQSTRPNYTMVSFEEEIKRLEKPLYLIKKNFSIPVSIDTFYSKTAQFALEIGADMINDIWGLTYSKDMANIIAKHNASVCIMHNSNKNLQGEILPQIISFLNSSISIAHNAGIDKNKICIDGGIGFAKSKEQNLKLLDNYEKLHVLGYPLLLGTSRKSLFGGNVEDRLPQTINSTKLAVHKKVLFVRVHDIKENMQAIKEEYDKIYG